MQRKRLMLLVVLGLMALGVAGCGMMGAPDFARMAHTPIPPLPPATLPPEPTPTPMPTPEAGEAATPTCRAYAVDVIGAWVNAGMPKDEPFTFTDVDGKTCQATFEADVLPLFTQGGTFYDGSIQCTVCHNKAAVEGGSNAGLSLETYEDILAGSYRPSPNEKGNDILGGGNWEQSIMYERLVVKKDMPLGRPPSAEDKVLEIGTPVEE